MPMEDGVNNNLINDNANTLDMLRNYPINNIGFIIKLIEYK